jgi:ribonuclease E
VDELGPTSAPEATSAAADFDGYNPPEPSLPVIQPESIAPPPSPEPQPADHGRQEARASSTHEETAQEAERAARRRSTVREKVSFLTSVQPEATTPANHSPPEPPSAPSAPAEPASEAADTQPRRAGWWSRRFGNGE